MAVNLQERIQVLETELQQLRDQLAPKTQHAELGQSSSTLPLELDEYRRYGRQMILDGFGLQGDPFKSLNVQLVNRGTSSAST